MKAPLLIVVCLLALGLSAACDDEEAAEMTTPAATISETASPTDVATRTASPSPATATPTVCKPSPDPATPEVLQIDEPQPGDTVSNPFTVSGRIAAFEATFQITLFDADGKPITDLRGRSAEGQTLSPFSEQVSFPPEEGGAPACLWVYERSAADDSTIHVGQVPLTLAP